MSLAFVYDQERYSWLVLINQDASCLSLEFMKDKENLNSDQKINFYYESKFPNFFPYFYKWSILSNRMN